MTGKRYPEECKIGAVRQVTERGHPAKEVPTRLGELTQSISASGATAHRRPSGTRLAVFHVRRAGRHSRGIVQLPNARHDGIVGHRVAPVWLMLPPCQCS